MPGFRSDIRLCEYAGAFAQSACVAVCSSALLAWTIVHALYTNAAARKRLALRRLLRARRHVWVARAGARSRFAGRSFGELAAAATAAATTPATATTTTAATKRCATSCTRSTASFGVAATASSAAAASCSGAAATCCAAAANAAAAAAATDFAWRSATSGKLRLRGIPAD